MKIMGKKAKIIDISSPDTNDLYTYQPDDPENFSILLQICVGVNGENDSQKSGETFDMEIYTPKWLLSVYNKEEVLLPKHSLIVFEYDFEKIFQKIQSLVESCRGDSWIEIAEKVGKFAAWEFEDYQGVDD